MSVDLSGFKPSNKRVLEDAGLKESKASKTRKKTSRAAGRPRKEEEPLTESVRVYFTPTDRVRLEEIAKGVPLAVLIRNIVKESLPL